MLTPKYNCDIMHTRELEENCLYKTDGNYISPLIMVLDYDMSRTSQVYIQEVVSSQ